jgi:predicted metal-dependent peptidase
MATDLSDPVVSEIVRARVKLLFDKPFFGHLATRLVLVDGSSWCPTMATDGKHLFYNRQFVAQMSRPQLLFVIAHEVLHCVYDHLGRRGGRDPKIWNMATDYIVNYTLVADGLGEMPAVGLYDKRFTDEMASEEIYEILKKNSVTIKMPLDMHLDGPGDKPEDGDGEGKGNGGVGNSPGGTTDVTIMGKDGPPKLTEEDIQKIRNEIRAAVIQSAQTVGAGNIPAGVARMIDELINPKLDWRALLDAHIRSSQRDDFSFRRPSRKSWGTSFGGRRLVLPSQDYMDTIDIAIAIDTSGSMTAKMLRDILSETKGIMQTFRDFKLQVWSFDTKVYSYKEFTGANLDEIDTYHPDGGGGTMFECNWEFMKRESIEPQRLVLFTDGYPCGTWGEENYCDTLFVVHGNTSIKAPFGLTAYYEEKDD